MNDRQIAGIRAAIDAVWTLTVVGIIAYAGRRELRAFIARKRSEIDARTAAVNAKTAEARARLGFARHDRERIIAEEFDVMASKLADDGYAFDPRGGLVMDVTTERIAADHA